MKDKNTIWKYLNKNGFSLVEVIVSMTLLVVVATILLTGVMAAGAINAKSTDLTNEGYNQAAELEEAYKNESGGESYNVAISSKGEDSVVSGYLISSKDDATGVGFTMFLASSADIEIPPGGGGSGNTPTQALIGGNTEYAISSWPSLSDYFFAKSKKKDKISIKPGVIFHEDGKYYISGKKGELENKDRQDPILPEDIREYITDEDDEDGPNAVIINIATDPVYLPQPSTNTRPGDLKLIGNNLYVFYPKKWEEWEDSSGAWKSSKWESEMAKPRNWIPLPYF